MVGRGVVADSIGALDGDIGEVGLNVAGSTTFIEGGMDGSSVGSLVVGLLVGTTVGDFDGVSDGCIVVGLVDGEYVEIGFSVGTLVGFFVGGEEIGFAVGSLVGDAVVGLIVGSPVGDTVVGLVVGSDVGPSVTIGMGFVGQVKLKSNVLSVNNGVPVIYNHFAVSSISLDEYKPIYPDASLNAPVLIVSWTYTESSKSLASSHNVTLALNPVPLGISINIK